MCPNVDIRKVYFYLWLFWVFVAAQTVFSSCSEQGLLSSCGVQAFHCRGFSCCGAQSLGIPASVVVAPGL